MKCRFAPSPTGLLHVGNARSAVLNWAYCKKNNGRFVLRIDDTDQSRSTKEYENKIKENLTWLGLNWDITFNQSDRIDNYSLKIEKLKKDGRLYPCFETAEELSLKKKSYRKLSYGYLKFMKHVFRWLIISRVKWLNNH